MLLASVAATWDVVASHVLSVAPAADLPPCIPCYLIHVLQAIAEQYLPRIDNPGGMELVVEDAVGDKYTLRFRYNPTACHDPRCHNLGLLLWCSPLQILMQQQSHNCRFASLIQADQPGSMLAAALLRNWQCCSARLVCSSGTEHSPPFCCPYVIT